MPPDPAGFNTEEFLRRLARLNSADHAWLLRALGEQGRRSLRSLPADDSHEEVLQGVLVKLWKHLPAWTALGWQGNLEAMLRTIIANAVRDQLRRRIRYRHALERSVSARPPQTDGAADLGAQAAETSARLRAVLLDAIGQLPGRRDRVVLKLELATYHPADDPQVRAWFTGDELGFFWSTEDQVAVDQLLQTRPEGKESVTAWIARLWQVPRNTVAQVQIRASKRLREVLVAKAKRWLEEP